MININDLENNINNGYEIDLSKTGYIVRIEISAILSLITTIILFKIIYSKYKEKLNKISFVMIFIILFVVLSFIYALVLYGILNYHPSWCG